MTRKSGWDAWNEKFYYPMPGDAQDIPDVPPVDPMQAEWDALPGWAREHAHERQERRMGGHPPICPGCKGSVITYPFAAIESYQGVRHTWCEYPEKEAVSA